MKIADKKIVLHIKYQVPIVIKGKKVETDKIIFYDIKNMESFINGNIAYDFLDDTVYKKRQ